ncbi:hypothetical protein HON22_03685, partial [Candidatus Peregrinibacteria bacterium]|nr:hypothetical protein [Candidatus Peregrinibacteria bacterium]
KEDFEKGETLYIKQVWLKDLYASSDSYYPILEYGEGETVSSPKYLSVKTSSSSNSQAPDSPYNQKLEVADGNKVKVSWEDPYDLDVTQIILLRGKNTPASGTVFSYIALGAQEYIDEDVSIGDKMQYYIIATDGRNRSLLGDPLEITVTEYVAPVLEDVIEEESEEVEESESEITTDNEEDLKEELESDVAEKEIVYSRKELQEQAKDVMQISKPLDRIKSVRSQLKKFTKFTDKIWFMRYVIQERNK